MDPHAPPHLRAAAARCFIHKDDHIIIAGSAEAANYILKKLDVASTRSGLLHVAMSRRHWRLSGQGNAAECKPSPSPTESTECASSGDAMESCIMVNSTAVMSTGASFVRALLRAPVSACAVP